MITKNGQFCLDLPNILIRVRGQIDRVLVQHVVIPRSEEYEIVMAENVSVPIVRISRYYCKPGRMYPRISFRSLLEMQVAARSFRKLHLEGKRAQALQDIVKAAKGMLFGNNTGEIETIAIIFRHTCDELLVIELPKSATTSDENNLYEEIISTLELRPKKGL